MAKNNELLTQEIKGEIIFKNVNFTYEGRTQIIKNFNLNIDPSEKHNIADKFPEKVEEIKKIAIYHLNSFEPPESVLDYRNSEEF